MSRIRTIKPEFWTNEGLSRLHESTHMLAAALLNYADDDGYFNANPALVKAAVSPLREPSVSTHDSLTALASQGFLRLGTGDDGRRYGHITSFSQHQRINRHTDSKIKTLVIVWESSLSPHTQLTEPSHPEGKGMEGNGKGKKDSEPKGSGETAPSDWDEDFLKKASFALAGEIGRRDAPTVLMRDGKSWIEIYALLVTAKSKADPKVWLSKTLVNREEEAAKALRDEICPPDIYRNIL